MDSETSFRAYVQAHQRRLLRLAFLLTGDQAAAEDLVQQAFVRVWPRWSRIVRGGEPDVYVRKVMLNARRSGWARRWNGEVATGALPEVVAPTEPVETRLVVLQALGQLPPRQRAVLVLRFFDDLTEAQTAEVLGIAVGTVKSQASKALATLRRQPGLSEVRTP